MSGYYETLLYPGETDYITVGAGTVEYAYDTAPGPSAATPFALAALAALRRRRKPT